MENSDWFVVLAQVQNSLPFKIGQGVPIVLVTAGVIKCFRIAKRETTNSKSVYALMLVLIGWLVSMLLSTSRSFFDFDDFSPVFLSIAIFGCAILVALVACAAMLAILGLAEIGTREPPYRQGKAQAIWALILCTLTVVLFTCGVVAGLWRHRPLAEERELSTEDPGRLSASGESLVFEELNFRIRRPKRPWEKTDFLQRANPAVTVAFIRQNPDIFFMLIAERGGVQLDMDVAQLCEAVKINARQNSSAVKFGDEKPRTRKGLPGISLEADATVHGQRLRYHYWLCMHNGFSYQLIASSPHVGQAELASKAEEVFSGFDLLDHARVAHTTDFMPADDFRSTAYGYSVHWENSVWSSWPDLANNWPFAESGALMHPHAACIVIPIHLLGKSPPEEAMRAALLGMMDISSDGDRLTEQKMITRGRVRGTSIRYDGASMDGRLELQYRIWLLSDDREAYLAAAWVNAAAAKAEEVLDGALSRIHFRMPPGAPKVEKYDPQQRKRQMMFFNELGLYYSDRNQWGRAAEYFRLAVEMGADDSMCVTNLVSSLTRSGKFSEAFDVVEAHYRRFPEAKQLYADHAQLHYELDRRQDAIREYSELFTAR